MPVEASRRATLVEEERVDEVVEGVGCADAVVDRDVEATEPPVADLDANSFDVDPRLPLHECGLDAVAQEGCGRGRDRLEEEVLKARAEVRTHDPFAATRPQDQPDRLAHLLGPRGEL